MRQQGAMGQSASPYVGDTRVEYFEPPSRLQLLAKLHHLIRFSDFLMLVEGEPGSGKTSLLRQLKLQTAGGRLCHLVLRAQTDILDLLQQLGAACGLDIAEFSDDSALLERLHYEARLAEDAGLQWLLLIDNADLLQDEALQLLVNLQCAGIASIRTVLADQRVYTRLVMLGLIEELEGRVHQEQLQPFSDEEAGDFIRLRYPALEVLDGRKLQQLVRRSDRMPGTLERLASQSLRLESPPLPLRRDRSAWMLSGASMVLLVMVGIAGWIYWMPEPASALSERVSVPLAVPVVAASVEQPATPIDVAQTGPALYTPPPLNLPDHASRMATEPEIIASVLPALTAPEPVNPPPVNPVPVLVAQDFLPETPALQGAGPVPAMPSSRASEPVSDLVEVVVAARSDAARGRESGMVEVNAVAPELTVVANSADVPQAPAASDEAMVGGEDLLNWSDNGYTLQLLGARQLATIKDFIADQSSSEGFYHFSTRYKGKPWHVVIFGRYASRKDASRAVQTLPVSLQKLKPWARSIQSVKSDIRKIAS
jgi:septal ring-binding cell division protein DamX/type II secretory pathway predicted ATPase ExeA